ncbi:hypothetical protein MGU_02693 [Metarhizium guizhouense ARSEF 977]|uniref:Uncharacterized protein n=1 Tax=Metarhizium guizhouense (strain ARSEF 977) TaxID=1276136 RepID=A0A0B4HLH7_METGA|nr:hypothetical protein MGU_02693 [Metarhizium guizhouense ARSEF 977]
MPESESCLEFFSFGLEFCATCSSSQLSEEAFNEKLKKHYNNPRWVLLPGILCHDIDTHVPDTQGFCLTYTDLSAPYEAGFKLGVEMYSPPYCDLTPKQAAKKASEAFQDVERAANIRIMSHEGYGMTIHVALKAGIRLMVARKAVTLVLLLEDQLLSRLCAPSRRDPKNYHPIGSKSVIANLQLPDDLSALQGYSDAMLAYLPWTGERLEKGPWNDHRPERFQNILRVLWNAEDIVNIRDILRYLWTEEKGRCALTFHIYDPIPIDKKQVNVRVLSPDYIRGLPSMFEFRYPESTFEQDFISNWIELSNRIIQIACRSPQEFRGTTESIWKTLEEQAALCRPAWPALLECLGLGTQIDYWKEKLNSYGHY